MNITNKFWWFALISLGITAIIIGGLLFAIWQQMAPDGRALLLELLKDNFIYLFAILILLVAGLGFALDAILHNYIIPVGRLASETALISSVNPSHRITLDGSKDISRLVNSINAGADRIEALEKGMRQRIQSAKAEEEKEKNILAAIMAELPEGILICNEEGQILLYNQKVKQFFAADANLPTNSNTTTDVSFIGLGRSVFSIIDQKLIEHALDEIQHKLREGYKDLSSHFMVIGKAGRLLRTEAFPVLDPKRRFTGFILILDDITLHLSTESRVHKLLTSFITEVRASAASIRSAIEAIVEYPQMPPAQLERFNEIIHQEAIALGESIEDKSRHPTDALRVHWPLIETQVIDFMHALQRKTHQTMDVTFEVYPGGENLWIKIDSYSLMSAWLFLIGKIFEESGQRHYTMRFEEKAPFVIFDLEWEGPPITLQKLREWENIAFISDDAGELLTINKIFDHHEAELGSNVRAEDPHLAYLRLYLATTAIPEKMARRDITLAPDSRPEFYDFDLFNQPGQSAESDRRQLSDLAYTVFDTETTGLNPQGGDEIVSIGAVRIINGRMLHEEVFDQLVDPKRSIPSESTRFHGIRSEDVAGQPEITQALPHLHRFAENTVLVAHNAAFDMRMLQIKEASSGVRFINPVLDTMLLSAVVNPSHKDHNLGTLAKRLGVKIVGRHTAMGDAVATAEIFLKLLPLLKQMGIETLREARHASQQTYYARLKY